ncbi:MAG: dTDP-4-dehydrorhamnose reductase [Candidatus Zipacnadales bacterium]
MSRVLITGGKGMLGRALSECVPPCHDSWFVARDELDITDVGAVQALFAEFRPHLVLHCAALTNVDGCETDPQAAERVNVQGTEHVARACGTTARLVYISTDFVFDGRRTEPYTEDDLPAPLSVYGHTKLEGEKRVRTLAPNHVIVRTAWTFAPWGHNFVLSILRAARERGYLRVVDDQVGSPTYALDLANALWTLAEERTTGVYHITNTGAVSRYELAKEIISLAGMSDIPIEPIKSVELNQPARRPAYSALASKRRLPLRPYGEALAECIRRIQSYAESTS